jgi:hypothetical protein
MRDWRLRLARWAKAWDRLPELTRDCFEIRPPSGTAWPKEVPTCAALSDLYALCDGGTFGAYTLSAVAELADPSTGWLAGSPGLDLKSGKWVDLGSHEYGHTLLWDAEADEVMLYSPDDEEPRRLRRTMEEFLTRLFYPSAKASNQATRLWLAALTEAETLDEYDAAADRPRE